MVVDFSVSSRLTDTKGEAMQLHEQHRPKNWSEVTGQNKVIAKLDVLRRRGLGGRTYWLAGHSGTGKTTFGAFLCAQYSRPANSSGVSALFIPLPRIGNVTGSVGALERHGVLEHRGARASGASCALMKRRNYGDVRWCWCWTVWTR